MDRLPPALLELFAVAVSSRPSLDLCCLSMTCRAARLAAARARGGAGRPESAESVLSGSSEQQVELAGSRLGLSERICRPGSSSLREAAAAADCVAALDLLPGSLLVREGSRLLAAAASHGSLRAGSWVLRRARESHARLDAGPAFRGAVRHGSLPFLRLLASRGFRVVVTSSLIAEAAAGGHVPVLAWLARRSAARGLADDEGSAWRCRYVASCAVQSCNAEGVVRFFDSRGLLGDRRFAYYLLRSAVRCDNDAVLQQILDNHPQAIDPAALLAGLIQHRSSRVAAWCLGRGLLDSGAIAEAAHKSYGAFELSGFLTWLRAACGDHP